MISLTCVDYNLLYLVEYHPYLLTRAKLFEDFLILVIFVQVLVINTSPLISQLGTQSSRNSLCSC